MRAALSCLLLAFAATAAHGGEASLQLKDGPGKEKVQTTCMICHSVDYIQINSVFLDRKGWEASVNKMIKVMGAPIKEEDIGPLVDYLSQHYGKQ